MEIAKEENIMKQYELVRVMGEGSFGKVFFVRDLSTRRDNVM